MQEAAHMYAGRDEDRKKEIERESETDWAHRYLCPRYPRWLAVPYRLVRERAVEEE